MSAHLDIVGDLRTIAALDPTAPVIEHGGVWYDWGRLKNAAEALERAIEAAGIGQDGRVGVLLRNRPGHVAAVLAIIASGRCLVTLNPLFTDEALAQDIVELKVPVVIGEPDDLARTGLLDAVRANGAAAIEIAADLSSIRSIPGMEQVADGVVPDARPGVAVEMLTSGTTGKPKRVPLTRAAFGASFAGPQTDERSRKPGEPPRLRSGVSIVNTPLTHIGGLYGVLGTLLGGRRICLLEKFSVEDWRGAIVRHRPRLAAAVPAALRMILDADIPREDLSSLAAISTGTAPLDPVIADAMLERYGIPVLANYGATEFAGAIARWSLDDFKAFWSAKRGAAGRIHADVDARIVDPDTGADLGPGKEGVLELRAAQLNAADRWVRTTDRAMIDEDRFLFIRGRADNAIIRGGFKIHPDDVVKVLETHPAVREATVVGIPDRRLGSVPVAVVIPRTAVTPEALLAFARQRLIPYQVPVEIRIMDDFPRTASMKPAAPQIRALFTST